MQFNDNTLFIGKDSWNNLWAIKAVLRGFGLVSGLWVNFHKSKFIGINVNHNFLLVAANFISCRIEFKEFLFLGIPIGIYPHRIKLWKFLVDNFRVRLAKWKGKLMSLGGIITLIKSV